MLKYSLDNPLQVNLLFQLMSEEAIEWLCNSAESLDGSLYNSDFSQSTKIYLDQTVLPFARENSDTPCSADNKRYVSGKSVMGYKVTINGQEYTVPASKCKIDPNRPGWMEVSLEL